MEPESVDVAVVGAGFAGLYALHRLRGLGLRVQVMEAAGDIGGTWFHNRYPGARCDIESLQYSYSFDAELEQEWNWSERFATQPEILRYLHHVADRFDLRRDISLGTRVVAVAFDEAAGTWTVTTASGREMVATYVVMATGCLSAPQTPRIPGLEAFAGEVHHTADWPRGGVDLAGRRVGVIGTGSSGIQAIPELAEQAGELVVFQRTPHFSVPARNTPLTPEKTRYWKDHYQELRSLAREDTPTGVLYDFATFSAQAVDDRARDVEFEARWDKGGANFAYAFKDLTVDEVSNDYAAEFVRRKIREIVKDSAVAERLCPVDYPIFTKRICVDSEYYDTYNRPNVLLVDLRQEPLERVTEAGLRTSAQEYALDVLVLATGFDAITGALGRIDIRGVGGLRLKEKWAGGPRTYLGLMSAGFPNFFMITGPGSPSVLSNVVVAIEQHVDWIADCLLHLRSVGSQRLEPTVPAEDAWVAHVNALASATLFVRAASWYMGANIPGKPRVFMPYIGAADYRRRCREIAGTGYPGFAITVPGAPSGEAPPSPRQPA